MYESRFGNSAGHNRCKHDPAFKGIFVHGGTSNGKGRFPKNIPNHFSVTTPNIFENEADSQKLWDAKAGNFITFKRALDHAIKLRDLIPELNGRPIYACTDLICEKPYCGRYELQLVA